MSSSFLRVRLRAFAPPISAFRCAARTEKHLPASRRVPPLSACLLIRTINKLKTKRGSYGRPDRLATGNLVR